MYRFMLLGMCLLSLVVSGCASQSLAPATAPPAAPTETPRPVETAVPVEPIATIVPTETDPAAPIPATRYFNAQLGFSFDLPEGWEIIEYPDYVQFTRPGAVLFVGFQRANEQPKPFRTGMGAGELIAGGTVSLLAQPIPKSILVAEGKNKTVDYGGRMTVGDLVLVIYLDAVGTPQTPAYEDFDLPPELIAEADSIVTSLKLANGDKPAVETTP